MKLSKLVGDRFKETPSDCVVASHALMPRGGYMKYVANGIYSSLPPLKRITKKIEEIIREDALRQVYQAELKLQWEPQLGRTVCLFPNL